MNNAPLFLSLVSCVASTAGRRRTDGCRGREREGNVLSLRSERENDFSETGGRDGRNRRFLIRPSDGAGDRLRWRRMRFPTAKRDGRTERRRRTDGESWERNPERKNAIYSPATITRRLPPQQPLSSTPPSLSATPKDRRRTHCDSAATNTSRLKIYLGAAAKRWTIEEEGVTFVVI